MKKNNVNIQATLKHRAGIDIPGLPRFARNDGRGVIINPHPSLRSCVSSCGNPGSSLRNNRAE